MTASFLSKLDWLAPAPAESAARANTCTNRHACANWQARAVTKTVEVGIVTNAIEICVASSIANACSISGAVTGACTGSRTSTSIAATAGSAHSKGCAGYGQGNKQGKHKSQIDFSFHVLISFLFH
jgi:hypothetical protein